MKSYTIINQCTSTLQEKCAGCVSPTKIEFNPITQKQKGLIPRDTKRLAENRGGDRKSSKYQ